MENEQNQEKTNEVSEQPKSEETQEQPVSEPSEEAAGAPQEEDIPQPDIYSMLHFMLGMLAEQAWQFMGIRLAPGQKEPAKDMAQAKVAIDTIAFIGDKLHPHLNEEDRKVVRGLISDLQMNFVVHNK